jgi:hypothetical protein
VKALRLIIILYIGRDSVHKILRLGYRNLKALENTVNLTVVSESAVFSVISGDLFVFRRKMTDLP